MVRRSSTTSRGTTYWFQCFSFPMSQLSGLRMRNFSDLMCLPKSREEKVTESVISDVRVAWERVSQKLNILTARRRGP